MTAKGMPNSLAEPNFWMLLAYGEDQQYQGTDDHPDLPQRRYPYDSLVANHKRLAVGDIVLLRGGDHAVGFARVVSIAISPGTKLRFRCPITGCGETDFWRRRSKLPPYRCHAGHDFNEPLEEVHDCTKYIASFGDTFRRAYADYGVGDLNAVVGSGATIGAIKPMSRDDFRRLVSREAYDVCEALTAP